jgi:hypothetical protein
MVDTKHSDLEDIERLVPRLKDTLEELEPLLSNRAWLALDKATKVALSELAARKAELELDV